MSEGLPPYLRLIKSDSHNLDVRSGGNAHQTQQMLFSLPRANALLFVDVDYFSDATFREVIELSRPRWIFDMRVAPRFDNITSSRADAFLIFERYAIEYIDLLGELGVKAHRSVELNLHFISPIINKMMKMCNKPKRHGPYMFLFDKKDYL